MPKKLPQFLTNKIGAILCAERINPVKKETKTPYLILILMELFLPLPSFAFAVIVTVPFFFAVTFPFLSTDAIFLLELDQVTFVLSAVAGMTVRLNACFPFTFMVFFPAIFTLETLTFCFPAFNLTLPPFRLPSWQ